MKELLPSLIEILAGLCFDINNRSDTCTLKRKQTHTHIYTHGRGGGKREKERELDVSVGLHMIKQVLHGNMHERQTRRSYVCPNVHMAPLNTSLDFLMLNKEIASAYTKLAPCQGASCIKFPAVRLINVLKISKGRGSCRKLIVTVAILLWIIFLFNILCSTWFSLLCCLPRFCSF